MRFTVVGGETPSRLGRTSLFRRVWQPVEIVLRPGCYITHDAGDYRDAQATILAELPAA